MAMCFSEVAAEMRIIMTPNITSEMQKLATNNEAANNRTYSISISDRKSNRQIEEK